MLLWAIFFSFKTARSMLLTQYNICSGRTSTLFNLIRINLIPGLVCQQGRNSRAMATVNDLHSKSTIHHGDCWKLGNLKLSERNEKNVHDTYIKKFCHKLDLRLPTGHLNVIDQSLAKSLWASYHQLQYSKRNQNRHATLRTRHKQPMWD